jgi:hypothetical protein
MSYLDIQPSFYEMFNPGDPWHAGGTGWTKSPLADRWGMNPNQVGPRMLAVEGLGRSPDGIGAYYATQYNKPIQRQFNGLGEVATGTVVTTVAAIGAVLFTAAYLTGRIRGLRPNPRRRRRRRR